MKTEKETKKITCIICPNGCELTVDVEDDEVVSVNGNQCLRGMVYAEKEILNPTRTVTSTVAVTGGEQRRVSVKTARDIPKDKMMACASSLKHITVEAPVHIGDVIAENIAQTGVDIIATVNVNKK